MDYSTRPFPSLWKVFERVINGKIRKFWVQDLPADQMDLAVEYLCEYFCRDEPMCRSLKLIEDENAIKSARVFWKEIMKQKCSLACYTKLENGENKLVAVNCCYKKSANDPDDAKGNVNDGKVRVIFDIFEYIFNLKNPFQELGIDSYLGAMGLVTHPEYRGHNIGLEVLNARRSLCSVLGLKASVTFFTAPASQRLAEKAGFQVLLTVTFDELEKKNPSWHFTDIKKLSMCIRNMYIIYE